MPGKHANTPDTHTDTRTHCGGALAAVAGGGSDGWEGLGPGRRSSAGWVDPPGGVSVTATRSGSQSP